jgi:transposase InsO family protein
VERTALWVKYYNHKRPHQGIGGLCPADRFFEIATDLRQTIEKGLEENALELADERAWPAIVREQQLPCPLQKERARPSPGSHWLKLSTAKV